MHLTQDQLQAILNYDPSTGVFTWKVDNRGPNRAGMVAGTISDRSYIIICIDRCDYRAHRLAWYYVHGEWPAETIDHKNGDRLDNRIDNLRKATLSQNQHNRDDLTRGVESKQGKYAARIMVNRKRYYLGTFDTREEAQEAYNTASIRLNGEFSSLSRGV